MILSAVPKLRDMECVIGTNFCIYNQRSHVTVTILTRIMNIHGASSTGGNSDTQQYHC